MAGDGVDRRAGLGRRGFLAGLGVAGAAAVGAGVPGRFDLRASAAAASVPPIDPNFPLGIAAGDPHPTGSVIWSKVPDSPGAVAVDWEVANDEAFSRIARRGSTEAVAETDHTVKVVVDGLRSDAWYFYRFRTAAGTSRVGRLRTAPVLGRSPQRLRFAFSSCQQINESYYVAHLAMAKEDIDFWVHYGDYIYVNDFGTISLDDYRGVYRRFKANPMLQELHARYPVVAMWDDGEFVNGIDRTFDPARFDAARQAWFDYQPVTRPERDPNRTYRKIGWGDLVSFLLLDVRQYRDPVINGVSGGPLGLSTIDTHTEAGAHMFDPNRTCLGQRQKHWLTSHLASDEATWRHIGHGYNFLAVRLDDYDTPSARANPPAGFHINGGNYVATDAWDSYWAERRRLMDFLADQAIPNVVATAGHTHVYFAGGLRPDYDDLEGSPVVAHEFVCGSLTADPDLRKAYLPDLPLEEAEAVLRSVEGAFLGLNPQIDYIDLVSQGYGLVEFTPSEARVWFQVIDTYDALAEARTRASWTVPAVASGEPATLVRNI